MANPRLPITSREYKVMLDHRRIANDDSDITSFLNDLGHAAARAGLAFAGAIESEARRTIQFLDTPDHLLKHNRLILRRRVDEGKKKAQFTLKCRSEDRYLAQGKDLSVARGHAAERKFEEDIAARFTSRFSQSASVVVKGKDAKPPNTLGRAADLFPSLGSLKRDGEKSPKKTALEVVGGVTAHERVLSGPQFALPAIKESEVALIFWSHAWEERIIAAEFSFRYKSAKELYPLETAEAAFALFLAIQSLDWCLPAGTTKTQLVYGNEN